METLLARQNMVALHNYAYYPGDCFFDSMEWLTGVPSSFIRQIAMKKLRYNLSILHRPTMTIFANVHGNTQIPGLDVFGMEITEYTTNMGTSCRSSRYALWADLPAVQCTAEALNVVIVVHQYNADTARESTQMYQPCYDIIDIDLPKYHVLFSGPSDAGHYTPIGQQGASP